MIQTKSEAKVHAWIKQIESGRIKSNIVKCLDYIRRHPHTTVYEMRIALQMPHQTLTSAVSNLMDEGAVMISGERQQDNEWYSALMYVIDDQTREYIQNKRNRDKFLAWLKQGERYQHLVKIVHNATENNSIQPLSL